MGALRFALSVVGFMRRRPVHSGSPLVSLDSFGVVGYPRVRPGCSCVHPGSLGSLGFALRVVRFIRGRWVHFGSPWGSLGSSGVVGYAQVRPWGRWVNPGRWNL